jgi:hypothetical protein
MVGLKVTRGERSSRHERGRRWTVLLAHVPQGKHRRGCLHFLYYTRCLSNAIWCAGTQGGRTRRVS